MKISLAVLLCLAIALGQGVCIARRRASRRLRHRRHRDKQPCTGTCKDSSGACKCDYKCSQDLAGNAITAAMIPIDTEDMKENVQLQNIEKEVAKIGEDGTLSVTYYFTKPDPEACESLGQA